ncbi:hypothetical protein [Novosphingobium aquae]|uniref:DUF2306 domain-containing protein n=1 Tax=Novosphingobium aquae TaxID=3133435 RepID=A0ABU8S3N8_9SPHN
MSQLQKERQFYLALVLIIVASVFFGFAQTYLTRDQMFGSSVPLPKAVHVHGMAFLAWYVLLAAQAGLVMRGAMRLHRTFGTLSLALAAIMVAGGLLVIGVRMRDGLAGNPFWSSFSLVILSNLILFAGYFVAAIRYRTRADQHRRYIVLAAATGSGAAQFRSLTLVMGQSFWAVPTGILVTNLFVIAAMVGEKAIRGKVSTTYKVALAITVAFELALFGAAFTSGGTAIQEAFVALMGQLLEFY